MQFDMNTHLPQQNSIVNSSSKSASIGATAATVAYQPLIDDNFNFTPLGELGLVTNESFAGTGAALDYFSSHHSSAGFGLFDGSGSSGAPFSNQQDLSSADLLCSKAIHIKNSSTGANRQINANMTLSTNSVSVSRNSDQLSFLKQSGSYQQPVYLSPYHSNQVMLPQQQDVSCSPVSNGAPLVELSGVASLTGLNNTGSSLDLSTTMDGIQTLPLDSHREFFDLCTRIDSNGFVMLNTANVNVDTDLSRLSRSSDPCLENYPTEYSSSVSSARSSGNDINQLHQQQSRNSSSFFPVDRNQNIQGINANLYLQTVALSKNRRRALTVGLSNVHAPSPTALYSQFDSRNLPSISENHNDNHVYEHNINQADSFNFVTHDKPPSNPADPIRPFINNQYGIFLQQQPQQQALYPFSQQSPVVVLDPQRRRRSIGAVDSSCQNTPPSNNENLFTCPFPDCNKTFSRFYNLKSHQRTHTGERPYICDFPGCTARFGRNHDLKRHRRVHTGDRPYQCEVCSKTFSRLDALNRHLKVSPPEH